MPVVNDKHGGVRLATKAEVEAGASCDTCRWPREPLLLTHEKRERQLPVVQEQVA